ncbi:Vesicle-fusing ATPase [Astathelohania contejeani]|uniref:Vesicular-fusion protein SEC18 n=1 Tax=Astathelohania contejeani TaxID=164912 RepID=A0ABQ7I2Q0_9MICR|nr:Vesicle-fusing ATPase [Thelohania contejeani]
MKYRIVSVPSIKHGKINRIYISASDKSLTLSPEHFILVNEKYPFNWEYSSLVLNGTVAFNKIQREFIKLSILSDNATLTPMRKRLCPPISLIRINVKMINIGTREVARKDLIDLFKKTYSGFPFSIGQSLYLYDNDTGYILTVTELIAVGETNFGIILPATNVYMVSSSNKLVLIGTDEENLLLKADFNFESLGIGGLKKEFGIMFRRAFVQRIFEPSLIKKLGIPHVKGIMLYGPPGTGKTLIARQIGSLLNARPPKIVNGPEILNKYVGQSEENIRKLFKDAEEEYQQKKEKSLLHIIIFDEIDAICKSRGSLGNAGIGDQVVNQLLSKMDGVEALDNVLVIGMTNRLDLIDKALLRPGRFEIHIEISLPDEESRFEIFTIHTKEIAKNKMLAEDVNLHEMARMTRNYTGAEITALVKSAVSYALERKAHGENKGEKLTLVGDESDISVSMSDFMMALEEVKPAFGCNEEDFKSFNRVYYELPFFIKAYDVGRSFINKMKKTNLYNTSSLLYYGKPGVGKTTLAVKVALDAGFTFVKMICPRDMVGLSDFEKVHFIKDRFMDAYKSEESIIILDDIESLIDYVSIGPRFSNSILQALKIFIKSEEKNKLFVIGTTSDVDILKECGIYDCFYGQCGVREVGEEDFNRLCEQNSEFKKVDFESPCSIKKLLSLLESPDEQNE